MKYRYQPKRPGVVKRTFTNLTVILVLVANTVGASMPFVLSQRAFAASNITVCDSGCDWTNIPDALNAASANDTITVSSTQTITSTVVVNKDVDISGSSTTINTSGSSNVFHMQASGSSVSGFNFVKSDDVFQEMIWIQGSGVTISGNTFDGGWNIGDESVVIRAMVISTSSGTNISGNTFNNVRQPAYINDNSTGTITNNYLNNSKGWVMVANTNFTFTGNTFGTNVLDIAFIPGTPNNYSCSVMAAIATNNDNAVIQNQTMASPCPPMHVSITNVAELRAAIENQFEGQTWTIQAGNYGLAPFPGITTEGQAGWYFPITANNLTINGVGNPTIYGTGFTPNGNWATQNFVSVFGDNVTINGLNLMPKDQPNKTVEVLGANFTLKNTTFTPNTLTNSSDFSTISSEHQQSGGSLYFSNAGNHTVENVTIKNGGISYRYYPTGTNITLNNVNLKYESNVNWINSYRYSTGFNNSGNTVIGQPNVTYHVNSTLNNLESVKPALQDGDNVEIDSDITTGNQWTLTKSVKINGNGNAIDAAFTKTDNSNNSAIGVQADNISISNLTVDGANGTDLHGINLYEADGVVVDGITSKNFRSGFGINSSTATLRNVTTIGNTWHGINVDTKTAHPSSLTIENTSMHGENSPVPPSGFVDGTHVAHIFIDDATDGTTVNDVNGQYEVAEIDFRGGRSKVYTLKPSPNIAPVVSFETPTPAEGSVLNGSTTITPRVVATDDYGMGSYYIRLWKDAFEPVGTLVANNCWSAPGGYALGTAQDVTCPSINTADLADGTYVLSAQFLDANGSTWGTAFRTFTIDKTAPATPTNLSWTPEGGSAMGSGYATNIQKGTLSWQDLDTSVDRYKYYFWTDIPGYFEGVSNAWTTEGSAFIVQSPTGGSIWTDFYNLQGTYFFCVKAIDAAANTSNCSDTFSITYDNTAPYMPIHQLPANNAVIGFNNFWFDWTDASGATKYETQYSQNLSVDANGSFTNVMWTGDYQNIQPTQSKAHSVGATGTWYWQVRSLDDAGNKSAWTSPWKLTIDMVAPDAPLLVNPGNGTPINGASPIANDWQDVADANYYTYQSYNVDSSGNCNLSSIRWTEDYTASQTNSRVLADGLKYCWRVKAVDLAANQSTWSDLWMTIIDNSGPSLAITPITGNVVDTSITPDVTASDPNSPITYSWAQTSGPALTFDNSVEEPVFSPTLAGSYTFELTAYDSVGNSTTQNFSFNWETAPAPSTLGASTDQQSTGSETNSSTTNSNPDSRTSNNRSVAVAETSEVLAEETSALIEEDDANARVLQAETESDSSTISEGKETNESNKFLGLPWWLWIMILIIIGGIMYFIFRPKNEE